MKPEWQKLASLAQEICTLKFQCFGAVCATKGYPFKNIYVYINLMVKRCNGVKVDHIVHKIHHVYVLLVKI